MTTNRLDRHGLLARDGLIRGQPRGWLQFRTCRRCEWFGHAPIRVRLLQLTRCKRCGLALAVDEQDPA
jgi:hypothetical protein